MSLGVGTVRDVTRIVRRTIVSDRLPKQKPCTTNSRRFAHFKHSLKLDYGTNFHRGVFIGSNNLFQDGTGSIFTRPWRQRHITTLPIRFVVQNTSRRAMLVDPAAAEGCFVNEPEKHVFSVQSGVALFRNSSARL